MNDVMFELKRLTAVFAALVAIVSLSSCNKEKGDYFQGASQEDVLRRLEGQPCGIPERKQKCEFDKNAIDLGLSVYWSRIPLGAEYVGDYGDYYCWGNLEPSDPELIYDTKHWVFGSKEGADAALGDATRLPDEYDAAVQKIGHGWRLPTVDDVLELTYAVWSSFVTYGEHSGCLVWNQKGAFFIAGERGNGNNNAYCWCSDRADISSPFNAMQFYVLSSGIISCGNTHGYIPGFIFPVKDKE